MVTKYLQTLNLKFDKVMFNSLVLTWERNFEVTFGIFSVLVFQLRVLESYIVTLLKYVKSQRSYGFLITEELILILASKFWIQKITSQPP